MSARFYITTAIDYVNGRPHLGHAYEKVLADVIARVHRQRGRHHVLPDRDRRAWTEDRACRRGGGAESAGLRRRALGHVRRSMADARRAVRQVLPHLGPAPHAGGPGTVSPSLRCPQPQDRLAGALPGQLRGPLLRGLRELQAGEGSRSTAAAPSTAPSRSSSGRRTSSFASPSTTRRCSSTSRRIRNSSSPTTAGNEVLNVIKEGLQDISVSRPNLPWGIPLPEEIPDSAGHTAYVWPDALLNYLSAIGWPDRKYSKWWLAKRG